MADSVAEIQKAKKLYFFIGMLLHRCDCAGGDRRGTRFW